MTFLKPDGISCTLGERDIYDIYADTFINSGLWLSKLEKMFFVIHRVKLSYCCCYFLYVETEPHPGPTNTDIEKLHIE